jgi:hypothetical protein
MKESPLFMVKEFRKCVAEILIWEFYMSQEKNLEGLGGWLVLVAIGIVLSPLQIIILLSGSMDMFSNGTWDVLTTPGTEAYNSLWGPMIIAEMSINIGLIIAWIYIAFLFFGKKMAFPKWYISILLFTLVFIFIDALAVSSLIPNEPIFDADTGKEFIRSLFVVMVWVPYMMISKRVKTTFVN